jgi:hypothetical protein
MFMKQEQTSVQIVTKKPGEKAMVERGGNEEENYKVE